ncbi:hypothetical protein ACF0H5_022885 [Mactra antiquata]
MNLTILSVCLLFAAIVGSGCAQNGGCPDVSVVYHDSCYFFGYKQPMTFLDADNFCRTQHHGRLVEIGTPEENAFVKNYLSRLSHTENFWLGMTDQANEHDWRWHSSDDVVEFFDWAPGDPDNTNTNEDCVVFWYERGFQWADVPCPSFKAEPVCEKSISDITEIIG